MARARFLAGAAVLAAACALPTSAYALTPCLVLGSPMPPPCIVFDASKAIQQAQEIKSKAEQLQTMVNQAKEMTSIQGALGKVKGAVKLPYEPLAPLAPIANISLNDAVSQLSSAIPAAGNSQSSNETYLAALGTQRRAAAGDGWSIASLSKGRLVELDQRARTIQAVAICTARRNKGEDESLRTDWQINTRAKSLLIEAMGTLREVQSARMQAKSVNLFERPEVANGKDFERASAPVQTPVIEPHWAATLGSIAGLSNKLSALMTAASLVTSFKDAISGHQQTQTEYKAILSAAQTSEARLQSLAANDARRKGKSVQALLSVANQYMAQDRTAWDDPAKADTAARWAKAAEKRLDDMVSGDVSNSWSDYLENRAEAYKQEAFFRPIAEEAKALEADTVAAMNEYSSSLGLNAQDPKVLAAEIAKVQQELGTLGNSMNGAPADVLRQRDAIYQSTVGTAAQAQAEMNAVDQSDVIASQTPIQ